MSRSPHRCTDSLEHLQDAAAVFAALVRRRSTAEGLPLRMLVAIGTR